MPEKTRPTAYETALLALLLVEKYEQEKERKATRVRISAKTLRRISLRGRLEASFIDDWSLSLLDFGWITFPIDDNYGLIRREAIADWPRLGSQRINPEIQALWKGDALLLTDLADRLSPPEESEDD